MTLYGPILLQPDPHGFVRGGVYDALSGRPLPGASIRVGDHSTFTAADEYFALTVPAGTHAAFGTAESHKKVKMPTFVVAAASVTHLEAA